MLDFDGEGAPIDIHLLAYFASYSLPNRRLRIGHTRVTHKYLLSGDSQPLCDKCQCSLTVKHILLECCSLKDVREKYFMCSSLKELFENVDGTTIMDFIKEVNFYHLV